MIKFEKPTELNAEQLVKEIKAKSVFIDESLLPLIDGNGDLWLAVDESDEKAIAAIVKAHKAVYTEPSIADKLAAAGISLDELKVALGI
jgi:hypothetical protein